MTRGVSRETSCSSPPPSRSTSPKSYRARRRAIGLRGKPRALRRSPSQKSQPHILWYSISILHSINLRTIVSARRPRWRSSSGRRHPSAPRTLRLEETCRNRCSTLSISCSKTCRTIVVRFTCFLSGRHVLHKINNPNVIRKTTV